MANDYAEIFGEEFHEEELTELEHNFNRASAVVQKLAGTAASTDLLYLYARFKQATEGQCTTQKPGFFDLKNRQKWEAWKGLGDMTKEDAMKEYIDHVRRIEPDFDIEPLKRKSIVMDCSKVLDEGDAKAVASNGPKAAFGLSVSTPQRTEQELSDDEKNLFDWVRQDRADKVGAILRANPESVNASDVQGLTPLHWACDRGSVNIVRILLNDYNAKVNVIDSCNQTPLHYASSCGYEEIVRLLIEHGADVRAVDDAGNTCADVALDDRIRHLFDDT